MKKILCAILSLMLIAGAVASCGDTSGSAGSDETTAAGGTGAAETTSAEELGAIDVITREEAPAPAARL